MDTAKDIEPITALKRETAELIARARERRSPIIITQNGRPTAVLQDVESYERQRQTLLLLKLLVQGEEDYAAGRTVKASDVRARVAESIAQYGRDDG